MQVQEAQVQELTQDPDNSRSHDRKNLEAIKQSLEAFGQQKPIVIDQEGKVVAGNGTLAAAQELGWKTIQAVVTDLEGAKQTAYAIADNRTAELAGWDDDQLAQSLARLQNDQTIDETIAGFTLDEIEAIQIPDFQPVGSEEQSKLDRTATHICPECGHEF
jgi:ParB-like chromosome segregation protein Spo0J